MEDGAHSRGTGLNLLFMEVLDELKGKLVERLEVSVFQICIEFLLKLGKFFFKLILDEDSKILSFILELLLKSGNSFFVFFIEFSMNDFLHLFSEVRVLNFAELVSVLLSSIEVLGNSDESYSNLLSITLLTVKECFPDVFESPVLISLLITTRLPVFSFELPPFNFTFTLSISISL